MKALVALKVSITHAAAAEFLDDSVVRDCSPDEGIGLRHTGAILGCAPGQVNELPQNSRPCSGALDVGDNCWKF